MLESEECQISQRIFLVVEETSRTLAYHFMRASEGKPRVEVSKPFLLDMTIPETSPVVCVLQYLSGLLACKPGMARIIWQFFGDANAREWAAGHADVLRKFRRAVLGCAGKTKRRHGHFLKGPFNWCSLIDDRASPEYKEKVLHEYNTMPACCQRVGVAQTMKERGMDLSTAKSQRWLYAFATSVTMSLSSEERKHAHDRHFAVNAGGCAPWEQFVAQSCLHQANCILRATQQYQAKCEERNRRQQEQQQSGVPGRLAASPSSSHSIVAVDESSSSPSVRAALECASRSRIQHHGDGSGDLPSRRPRRPKARSPLELFKTDHVEDLKGKGLKVSVASTQFWKSCNEAWAELSPEHRAVYERMSECEKTAARHARVLQLNEQLNAVAAAAAAAAPVSSAPALAPAAPALPPPPSSGSSSSASSGAASGARQPNEAATVLVGAALPSSDLSLTCTRSNSGDNPASNLPFPVLPAILSARLEEGGLSLFKESFQGRANMMLQHGADIFDSVADYGCQCRGLCKSRTPQVAWRMQMCLLERWAGCFGPKSDNIMMVVEVYGGGGDAPKATMFAVLASAACQYGRHPARQDFLRLDIVTAGSAATYADFVLRPRRFEPVRPHPKMPRNLAKFFGGASGELDIVQEDIGILDKTSVELQIASHNP